MSYVNKFNIPYRKLTIDKSMLTIIIHNKIK